MTTWWLISDEDVRSIQDQLNIGPVQDWWGPNGEDRKEAFFAAIAYTLSSGLHTTDAIPADFQPIVTAHVDPDMKPETAHAFGEMVRLATEMVAAPPAPSADPTCRCGRHLINPGDLYPWCTGCNMLASDCDCAPAADRRADAAPAIGRCTRCDEYISSLTGACRCAPAAEGA